MATYALMGDTISNAAGNGPPNFPFGFSQATGVVKDLLNSSYVITNTDAVFFVTSSTTLSVNQTVTLPSAASNIGRQIKIKKSDSSTFALQVVIPGGDTLDGFTAAYPISSQGGTITVYAYAAGKWALLEAAKIAPTIVRYTTAAGTLTYTPQPYITSIMIEMAGGGGGGGGGASGGTAATNGFAGTASVWSVNGGAAIMTCNGGGKGYAGSVAISDPGGTVVIGTGSPKIIMTTNGQRGGQGPYIASGFYSVGGVGASSPLGGGACSMSGNFTPGEAATPNTGSGGGGGGTNNAAVNQGGNGGSSAGYARFILPPALYDYSVGANGSGGNGSSSGGGAGGAGALGIIIVTENYT